MVHREMLCAAVGEPIYLLIDDFKGGNPQVHPCVSLAAARHMAQQLCDEAFNERAKVALVPEAASLPRTIVPEGWLGEDIEYDAGCYLACVTETLVG